VLETDQTPLLNKLSRTSMANSR